jgi:hypothetical protein
MKMAELVDRATILRLKTERISDSTKVSLAQAELDTIDVPNVGPFEVLLYRINSVLWDVEDQLRTLENENNFGPEFVLLSRSVYFTNDLRSQVKTRISKILGEQLKDVKSYVN